MRGIEMRIEDREYRIEDRGMRDTNSDCESRNRFFVRKKVSRRAKPFGGRPPAFCRLFQLNQGSEELAEKRMLLESCIL